MLKDAETHSNYLFASCYLRWDDYRLLLDEHKQYDCLHRLSEKDTFPLRKINNGKIRIGFISPDFRDHSVSYFIEPVIQYLPKNSFTVYCYSGVINADMITKRIQSFCDEWRQLTGLDARQCAETIYDDKIDVLVDLSGHTGGNFLPVFFYKPAPLQISYCGYPFSTGLSVMDYKVVDSTTDAPRVADIYYTEKLMRLDGCFLCYKPPPAPVITTRKGGGIVFGSFNSLPKLNSDVISLWAEILSVIPDSKIIIKRKSLDVPVVQRRIADMFMSFGVNPNRVIFIGHSPNLTTHLEWYNRIDVALDTFPYNGTTTTCEALYMGVPVVALCGDVHMSRVSTSILNCIGCWELIAENRSRYVEIAMGLSKNRDQIIAYKKTLRQRIFDGDLCDWAKFADKFGKKIMEVVDEKRKC